MAQPGGTYNLVIQDNNGKPQYIKLPKGQSASRLIKAGEGKTVRTIVGHKPGAVAQVVTSSGSVIQGTSMLRTVSLTGKPARQYVTIPPNQMPKIQERSVTVIASPSPRNVATSSRTVTSSGDRSLKREMSIDFVSDGPSSNKRRKTEKGGKGLRHFSMKVCEKVKKKGLTSYNEVADELVAEFTDPKHIPNSVDQQYDQKNIRRRVYDALNVLMAMNIISKEKKEIRWLGLPMTTAQENVSLVTEKKRIADRIALKTQQLNELLIQQISYKNLMQRNLENEKNRGPPAPNSAIQLPFIVVNSDRKTVIDCSITNDKTEYLFVFNDKFEIKDDFEVLKQIGMTHGLETGSITKANLEKVKQLVPKSMEKYIEKMAKTKPASSPSSYDVDTDPEQAGPSSDGFPQEDVDSNAEDDTDDESNISTDLETN